MMIRDYEQWVLRYCLLHIDFAHLNLLDRNVHWRVVFLPFSLPFKDLHCFLLSKIIDAEPKIREPLYFSRNWCCTSGGSGSRFQQQRYAISSSVCLKGVVHVLLHVEVTILTWTPDHLCVLGKLKK